MEPWDNQWKGKAWLRKCRRPLPLSHCVRSIYRLDLMYLSVFIDLLPRQCWGDNRSGQLGLGHVDTIGDDDDEMGDALPYVDLGTSGKVSSLSLGKSHTCALFSGDGNVRYCCAIHSSTSSYMRWITNYIRFFCLLKIFVSNRTFLHKERNLDPCRRWKCVNAK